jgi:protein-tyrosine phosphatase
VEAAIARLQSAAGDSPRIHYGCDFHLNPENIQDALHSPCKYAIGHRVYLLVEFDDRIIPAMTSGIFAALIAACMRPVITHPERNPILRARPADLESWGPPGMCAPGHRPISAGPVRQTRQKSLLRPARTRT